MELAVDWCIVRSRRRTVLLNVLVQSNLGLQLPDVSSDGSLDGQWSMRLEDHTANILRPLVDIQGSELVIHGEGCVPTDCSAVHVQLCPCVVLREKAIEERER